MKWLIDDRTNIVDDVVGPLFFIIFCPIFALIFFHAADKFDGSIVDALKV
jgi:cobalamin biosynthesis protein CobD/CbiB